MNYKYPTAKISDNKIVLSLPDAMTPVVWVMDVHETGTFVMKIDQNENGQYILQKISENGKKSDDIAYYASQNKAIRAMTILTKIMDGNTKSCSSKSRQIMCCIYSLITFLAALCVLYVFLELFGGNIYNAIFENGANQAEITQQQSSSAPMMQQNPPVEVDPNAVGVPMSADDFLNSKPNSGFPF